MAIAREAGPVGSLHEVREAGLDREDLLGMYRAMLITRGVEERGHILYRQGLPGSDDAEHKIINRTVRGKPILVLINQA